MSNPYDPGYSPYQPPSGGGYGESAGPAFVPPPPPPKTDGISIAALVCSLTCCAAPVGLGLGIAGILRTRRGARSGRWAAITGVVLGTIGTLTMVAVIIGVVWVSLNIYHEDDARVGDCVNTTEMFGENDLWEASCREEHDAQIYAAGTFRDIPGGAGAYDDSRVTFCKARLEEADEAWQSLVADGDHRVDGSTDALDEDTVLSRDSWVCFIERVDGEKIDRDLSGSG